MSNTKEETAHILMPVGPAVPPTANSSSTNASVSAISGSTPASEPVDRSPSMSFHVSSDTKTLVPVQRLNNQPSEQNTPLAVFCNYVNSILGSGIVGIPYALDRAGFGLGIILLIALAVVTDYSLSLLVKSANLAGVSSYQDLVQVAFGRRGFYLITLLQFVYPFVACISYNIIIGDMLNRLFRGVFALGKSHIFANRNSIVFVATLFVTLPLSLQKDIAKMSKVSMLSLILILCIVMSVILRFDKISDIVGSNDLPYTFIGEDITQAIAIITFAYMCHHSSFLLYGSLEEPTQLRWDTVTHFSVAIAAILAMAFGIAGFATFKSLSQGDIFESFCSNDNYANVARFLFTITIMLTYPIECFVVRETLERLFWPCKELLTQSHHRMITIAIVSLTFILSTLTDCLGVVLELNGVLTAVPLAFVLPAISYLKLGEGKILSEQKIYPLLLALFGLSVSLIGMMKISSRMFWYPDTSFDTCSHGHELDYCKTAFPNVTIAKEEIPNKFIIANMTTVSRG